MTITETATSQSVETLPAGVTFTKGPDLARALTNALAHAGTDAARPVLNAVLLEVDQDGARFVATDSYSLIVETLPDAEAFNTPPAGISWVIPVTDVKELVRKAKTYKGHGFVILRDAGHGSITVETPDSSSTVRLVDSEYPNYRALVNKPVGETRTEFTALSTHQLAKLGKMSSAELMGSKNGIPVTITTPEDNLKPVWFSCGANITGLIMPTRMS